MQKVRLSLWVGRGVPAEPSDEERLTRRVRPTGWKRIKLLRFGGLIPIILVCMCAQVFAGNLEPPGPPGSSNSAMYTIEAMYQRLVHGTPGTKWTGGFRGPTAPQGPPCMI